MYKVRAESPHSPTIGNRTQKVVHRGLFQRELEQFWACISSTSSDLVSIDPAWLALLLCMLSWAVSTDLVKQQLHSLYGMKTEEAEQVGADWSTAAQNALVLADWAGHPQFRCLQVSLLNL